MRVMLDTNVLISMILFPTQNFTRVMEIILTRHSLVLSSFVINELLEVTERKFPSRKAAVERFLQKLSYEMVYTPSQLPDDLFRIRDMNDYPVLYSAIVEGIDIFITGDKDFENVNVEKPEICTPAEFLRRFSGTG